MSVCIEREREREREGGRERERGHSFSSESKLHLKQHTGNGIICGGKKTPFWCLPQIGYTDIFTHDE